MTNHKIAVLGAGSWGTALALHTAERTPTTLWSYREAHATAMMQARENRDYLPGYSFPSTLTTTAELADALEGATLLLLAIPSTAFQTTLERLDRYYQASNSPMPPVLSATKGLDYANNGFLSETFYHYFPNTDFAILSGPSFAKEVAAHFPTAIAIAAKEERIIDYFVPYFHFNAFRVYGNTDIKGVQLAGAYKNVIAIATGISDGLGFGANARAALITRGLAEMTRLGLALGGALETFMGLAGMGDLVLTATDNQSRNRRFGLLLGKGRGQAEAFNSIGQVVEGANIVKNIHQLGLSTGVELPIVREIDLILHQGRQPEESLRALLAREQKHEAEGQS